MKIKRVTARLGNMRKPQDFVVYPVKPTVENPQGTRLTVQSDKSIGQFDPATGKGVLNTRRCYFIDLLAVRGAVPFEFPKEFVKAALDAIPREGDEVGPGVEIG
jgi:hypothetical protein